MSESSCHNDDGWAAKSKGTDIESATDLDAKAFVDVEDRERTGTIFTTCVHIVTAMFGAGVLGLPNALSWLGWIAGPLLITVFYMTTVLSSRLLSDVVEVKGVRHATYRGVIQHHLGDVAAKVLVAFQVMSMTVATLAFAITAGTSGKAVFVAVGRMESTSSPWPIMLAFFVIELVLCQLPNLESSWITSAMGASMSVSYGIIAMGLCISHAGNMHGNLGGNPGSTTANKAFGVLNALGDISVAYNFTPVLVEIQDTIRTPPDSSHVMKKGIKYSITLAYVFYLVIAIVGYMAFGNDVAGSILSQPNIGPEWVIVMANTMVFVHMIAAFQMFTIPLSTMLEKHLARQYPTRSFNTKRWVWKLILRSVYAALIIFLAVLLPFFNEVLGLIGALVYWPTSIIFPFLAWIAVFKPKPSTTWALHGLSLFMLLVAICALIGSIRSIIVSASTFGVFN